MKKYLVLLLMMVLMAGTATMALPPVKVTKCATCGLPIGRCEYKGKHPTKPKKETPKPKAKCKTCGKTIDNCPYGGKHPAPVKKCATCGQPVNNCQYGGSHPNCPTCGKVVDNCQYGGTHPNCPTCGKVVDNCQYGGKHPKCSTCGEVVDNCPYGILTQEQSAAINDLLASMVWVDGGTFMMGTQSVLGREWRCARPAHQVTLSGFYMCKYEVTQELWQAVMGTTVRQQRDKANPSWNLHGEGANYPMYYISWEECQTFINKLNHMTGKQYRLPTEAEWEYAARGGNRSRGYKYAGSNTLGDVAWYCDNSGGTTHPVGQKLSNELGLYDMSGNVEEWCQDWYGDYGSGSQTNPTGPSTGTYRVCRGSSYNIDMTMRYRCHVVYRTGCKPTARPFDFGLRLAL